MLETPRDREGLRAGPPAGSAEELIRALYEITSDYGRGFENQVERILRLGCERFGLEIGILSRVIGDRYEILRVVAPADFTLERCATFRLEETLCASTIKADGPVGFERISRSEGRRHPAYCGMGLQAYVGTPVRVEGEIFGTLNFSSPVARRRRFDETVFDALRLMSNWVAVEIHRRRTEEALRAATAELLHLTRLDPLTELLNRRGMQDALDRISQRVRQGDPPFTALLVDLDSFKQVNDRHGHAAGDRVIQESARRIRNAVRPTDVVSRIGGDEFLLVLPGYSAFQALRLAERVRRAVSAEPILTDRGPVEVTASIGVAEIDADLSTIAEVLSEAGQPLAASKNGGKNRVSG